MTHLHTEMNEHDSFVFQTMLTCIGNKRKLVGHIRSIVEDIRQELKKPALNIVDGFAGSTVVSRELSFMAETLYSNDMEFYSYIMSSCFLVTPCDADKQQIEHHIHQMNNLATDGPFTPGIICKLYAPKTTNRIMPGERCFYTRENALIIDTLRSYIDTVPEHLKYYCLAPLLTKASIHTNTAGVFKGFYKHNDVGQFGGSGEVALSRILKPIRLDVPLWSKTSFEAIPTNLDITSLISQLPDNIDIIYLDPPYNQHPYGSNYFMLNVIAHNVEPLSVSKVSGIPTGWNKSVFNAYKSAVDSMQELIQRSLEKATYILLSYNNEGLIKMDDWASLLAPYKIKKFEIPYNTYKGSRNLANRNDKVMEIMYLISLQ